MKNLSKKVTVGEVELVLETGKFAQQASAAVTATYGETVVLATVVMGRVNESLGYFPLQVEYQEKLYAGGRIKGSRWVKREGRPNDSAVLKARLIDRTIRPLFPKGFVNEIQVIISVLSADGVHDAGMPAMYAVSAALAMSKIPWEGPVAAVRIGMDAQSGSFIINPTFEQAAQSKLDLIISGTSDAIVMVEAGAKEVTEEQLLEAFALAQTEIKNITTVIAALAKEVGIAKAEFTPKLVPDDVKKAVAAAVPQEDLTKLVKTMAALEFAGVADYTKKLAEKFPDYSSQHIKDVMDDLLKQEARRQTFEDDVRPDGRKTDEIRPLSSEVGILPRTHGSAMFKRGATQALTIATLGSPAMSQLIENMEGEETKRYIHHYSMPPFASGEAGRVGYPSRREIGHGALAERALEPMIPDEADFPYTIRIVSEILSSNGSTSMASVCGSTLSLMDAGVPLKKPVAGIAMGLLIEDGKFKVLSDIMGMEDHTGDMDFKVAGTADGVTAMQMDIKVKGISMDIVTTALKQAKVGRMHILNHMLETISAPRPQLSAYAPKIVTLSIPVESIGEIIGPGGKIIKNIIATTGAQVDVEDDGRVFITSTNQEALNRAKAIIEGILREVAPGEEFEGKVTRIETFGAFVEILPNKSGLVHVSNLGTDYIKDAHDVVNLGDTLKVRVIKVDDMGRIDLTVLTPEEQAAKGESRRSSGGGGGDRGGNRGGGGFGGGGFRDRRGGGGGDRGGRMPFRDR